VVRQKLRSRPRDHRALRGVLQVGLLLCFVGTTTASATAPSATCKIVKKKVHGQKKRVRVCTKPKPPALPQAGTVAATVPIGAQIQTVAASDNAVWVLTDQRQLLRVDPATNRVVATIALPDSEWPESNVAVGGGAVWVTVASPSTVTYPEQDSLLRIDPQTNRIVARIHVGHSPEGIGISPDSVWTANHRSPWDPKADDATGAYEVSRVSVSSNAEIARPVVEVRNKGGDSHAYWCCGPQGMTYAAGSIWTTDPQDSGNGLVIRVDPTTNAVVATIAPKGLAPTCGNMAGDNSSVWFVSGCDQPFVVRIDPQTNQVAATIGLGEATQDIALGLGSVWVATLNNLNRINPATNKIVAKTRIAPATAVSIGAGSIWVGNATKLVRLTPG